MKVWRVILATLVIFCAGMVAGGLLGRRVEPATVPANRAANFQSPGQFRLQQLERRMGRELALTADQKDRIHKIIAASQDRTKEMAKPFNQQVSLETQKVCDSIRDILTPEQRVKFDTFSKERPERGDHNGERGPRHRPGGTNNLSNDFSLRTND